jgi:hypothetical protein
MTTEYSAQHEQGTGQDQCHPLHRVSPPFKSYFSRLPAVSALEPDGFHWHNSPPRRLTCDNSDRALATMTAGQIGAPRRPHWPGTPASA